ncbi:hypothetical protein INT44_007522 [Umbelopsis vinacea]|uniref:Uncharacterized protein n=1 Tax=Umbelopsis vinacea TaxID=44442 RepID=A0A8H7UEE2_9FUNG|nr:hypothetical protein INT44_007522 [Umbelopsis vinacea]
MMVHSKFPGFPHLILEAGTYVKVRPRASSLASLLELEADTDLRARASSLLSLLEFRGGHGRKGPEQVSWLTLL